MRTSEIKQYDRGQVMFHWLIAAIILFMIALGLFMVQLPKQSELPPGEESVRAFYFLLHKSMGITVAGLILLRVIWRLTHEAPSLPNFVPKWQQAASKAVHGALYLLMVAMPVTGYLQSMYSSYDTKFWGIVLPRLADGDKGKREFFSEIHEILAFILIAVLVIHIAAAIRHRLAKNGIFERMSFRRQ